MTYKATHTSVRDGSDAMQFGPVREGRIVLQNEDGFVWADPVEQWRPIVGGTDAPTDEVWPRGRSIVGVRPISPAELEREGWEMRYGADPSVLVLDDGSLLYPSADPEGNGPGMLFGVLADGRTVSI